MSRATLWQEQSRWSRAAIPCSRSASCLSQLNQSQTDSSVTTRDGKEDGWGNLIYFWAFLCHELSLLLWLTGRQNRINGLGLYSAFLSQETLKSSTRYQAICLKPLSHLDYLTSIRLTLQNLLKCSHTLIFVFFFSQFYFYSSIYLHHCIGVAVDAPVSPIGQIRNAATS